MNRALLAAATGMAAEQRNLEIVAENLANADVAGFKGSAATFSDLAEPGGALGTAEIGTHTLFTQGKLMRSGGPFDLAIDGQGFFCVSDARGNVAYTRDGEFARASDGTLRNAQGRRLCGVRIPADALSAKVAQDGTVTVTLPKGKSAVAGRIRLAEFTAPEYLQSDGGTLFFETHDSGKAHLVDPGSPGGPSVKCGMLEKSNVTIIEAMMQILTAQRAYEANAKGVQAADEMLRIANNLSRG